MGLGVACISVTVKFYEGGGMMVVCRTWGFVTVILVIAVGY